MEAGFFTNSMLNMISRIKPSLTFQKFECVNKINRTSIKYSLKNNNVLKK